MIQELLGAVVEERKMSNIPGSHSPTTSAISSPSQSAASSPSSAPESLRCPRCDSPNTKFCYYNNYNLTQPRHFCKTCRRYWTKGGALRNVPIGGGCRKTKAAASIIIPGIANINKSGGCKPSRSMTGQLGTGGGVGLNLDLLPSLWGSSCNMSHSSQLLALLRASSVPQNPNHSHNYLNSIRMDQVKEERAMVGGSHILTDTSDPLGQVCNNNSSLWRNNNSQYQHPHPHQHQHQNQYLLDDTPTSSGIQELYQRLQSPANCGSTNYNMQLFNNNVGSGSSSAPSATMATATTTTTAATASILEPLPLFSGGEFGYWSNQAPLSWADLPMPNGAFP